MSNEKNNGAGAQVVSDRIEKEVLISAPQDKVWRALTDHEQFGQWFRMKLDGPFVAGAASHGQITHPGYEHVKVLMKIEAIQPQDYFAYRWHPYAVRMDYDYSVEPTTLVEFSLSEQDGATLLRVVESGFDRIPAERRDEDFRMNEGGWKGQTGNIKRFVEEGGA